jgi:hypothetical protein
MNTDRHANARDRKAAAAVKGKAMRGNRSVFIIAAAQAKRDARKVAKP